MAQHVHDDENRHDNGRRANYRDLHATSFQGRTASQSALGHRTPFRLPSNKLVTINFGSIQNCVSQATHLT
jgi:hypothetical protein